MGEQDPMRRVAQYRLDRLAERDRATAGDDAQAGRQVGGQAGEQTAGGADRPAAPRPTSMATRGTFADELVRQAMARGEFDDLPLTGKPIPGLNGRYDPDWWLKAFIEREQITGVLPEALQLRKDDVDLDARLDREHGEARVREVVAEFNARIVEARRQLLGGPPVITPTRDPEVEVARWRERRRARVTRAEEQALAEAQARAQRDAERRAGRWWRRVARWRRRALDRSVSDGVAR